MFLHEAFQVRWAEPKADDVAFMETAHLLADVGDHGVQVVFGNTGFGGR